MQPFITYRELDKNNELQYFVLQKEFPHCVCYISAVKKENVLSQMPIAGYNLYVVFNGTIRGNIIPSYKNIAEEIDSVIASMANWYKENRIENNNKRYNKFKIKKDDTTSTQ